MMNLTAEEKLDLKIDNACSELATACTEYDIHGDSENFEKIYWTAKYFVAACDARGVLNGCYPPIPPDAD